MRASPSRVERVGSVEWDGFPLATSRLRARADLAAVLALQRAVGNRAVAGMLARAAGDPDPRDAARARIRDLKRELDAVTEQAQDLVRDATGDHTGGRPAWPKRGRARPPKPGSKKSRAALRDWVRRGLEDLADGTGPTAERARGSLDQIEGIEDEIEELERGLRPPSQPNFKPKPTPAEKQPAKAKNPPANGPPATSPPAKAPPPKSNVSETLPPLPPEIAKVAAKEATRFKDLARRFASGVKNIAGKVAGPIAIALQILDALELIEMTETAVRGTGFIFRAQISQASDLQSSVTGLIASYRAAGLHADLATLIRAAEQNDERYSQYANTPQDYWGTEELSEWCLSITDTIDAHRDACDKLLEQLKNAASDVDVRLKYCKALLDNPAAMTALSYPTSAPVARVLMAHRDLTQISGILGPAQYALNAHATTVRDDAKTIDDNILQRGLVV
jgi:hypothetical protein